MYFRVVFNLVFICGGLKFLSAAVPTPSPSGIFTLYSPTVTTSLSDVYNCNSNTTGVNPPFNWTNPPVGTVGYAFLLGSYEMSGIQTWVASGFDWGIYDLASDVTSLEQNCSNPYKNTCGRAGAAWNNGHPTEVSNFYYWPPCSSDCLIKNYTFTVYALSTQITAPYHTLSNYNLSVIVQQPGMTLESASIVVWSLRTKGCDEPSFSPSSEPSSISSPETFISSHTGPGTPPIIPGTIPASVTSPSGTPPSIPGTTPQMEGDQSTSSPSSTNTPSLSTSELVAVAVGVAVFLLLAGPRE